MAQQKQIQHDRVKSPDHEGQQDPQIGEQEQARQTYRKQQERRDTPLEQEEVEAKNAKFKRPFNETNDEDSALDNGSAEHKVGEEDIAEQENEDLEVDDAQDRR